MANAVKTWCLPGQSAEVYVWAGFLSAEASYIKSKRIVKLKVRLEPEHKTRTQRHHSTPEHKNQKVLLVFSS